MLSFFRLYWGNNSGNYPVNNDGIVAVDLKIKSDGRKFLKPLSNTRVDAHHKNHPKVKGDLTVELYTGGNNINVRTCVNAHIVGGPAERENPSRSNNSPCSQTVIVLSAGGFFTVTYKVLSDRDYKFGTKGLSSNQNHRPGSYEINKSDMYVGYEFSMITKDRKVFLRSRSLVSTQAASFHEGPDSYFTR